MVAVAVTGATLASDCFAQHCDACSGAASVQYAPVQVIPQQAVGVAPCDTCAGAAPTVAYSAGGFHHLARGGHHGGLFSELKAKCRHQQAINNRIEARNAAWPKPFACADRQLYFSFFDPMINRGHEEQCVLTSAHFDSESNELNQFGQTAVAGIMQNMPSNRRQVFLNRDANNQISLARKENVEQTIRTFYGNSGPPRVAFSDKRPNTTTGNKGAWIADNWLNNQATPAIPVSVGGGVAGAVSGN